MASLGPSDNFLWRNFRTSSLSCGERSTSSMSRPLPVGTKLKSVNLSIPIFSAKPSTEGISVRLFLVAVTARQVQISSFTQFLNPCSVCSKAPVFPLKTSCVLELAPSRLTST